MPAKVLIIAALLSAKVLIIFGFVSINLKITTVFQDIKKENRTGSLSVGFWAPLKHLCLGDPSGWRIGPALPVPEAPASS